MSSGSSSTVRSSLVGSWADLGSIGSLSDYNTPDSTPEDDYYIPDRAPGLSQRARSYLEREVLVQEPVRTLGPEVSVAREITPSISLSRMFMTGTSRTLLLLTLSRSAHPGMQ